jgi:hypothetical protein
MRMIVAAALVVAGCGTARPPKRASPDAGPPTCLQLVSGLRRIRGPATTPERDLLVRTLEQTARTLHARFGVEAEPVAELYAAVARVRQESAHAIRDGRPVAARRLAAHVRVLDGRANALADDLVARCGGQYPTPTR